MRQFVVVGHDVPTTPEFSLGDLTGAGRLDLLARCVTAGFVLSHGIREDVRVHLVLDGEYAVHFEGSELQGLNPDERSTAALVRTALEDREEAIGHVAAETTPGVSISRRDLAAVLDDAGGTVLRLHENGDGVAGIDPPDDPVFVLSDERDLTDEEAALVDERADRCVSLGPRAIHADHAITVAHNYLDTDGFSEY
ncbi:tRNA (pseudouridine(54)-N(1))-methyltransferase TrmY [Halomicrobium urmianum]|uniref:tRNA (pseudouridine(54)-N(1))-methyltransferase TrmY n=1 Tax=Halomicrobium urmianum TaxID=1586233 RepID=UPI001CD956EE|nr:tRNA (pseudouridine(54)-N(1))-methyltransferase TrmY [Halomicrobium urmianum]